MARVLDRSGDFFLIGFRDFGECRALDRSFLDGGSDGYADNFALQYIFRRGRGRRLEKSFSYADAGGRASFSQRGAVEIFLLQGKNGGSSFRRDSAHFADFDGSGSG